LKKGAFPSKGFRGEELEALENEYPENKEKHLIKLKINIPEIVDIFKQIQ